MATYSAYTTTTCSTTNKASLSSSSKTYTSKAGQSSTTRYIKNTLPISYQHNSLKTTSTITRCKPTSRYYASTCAPSLAEASRLERNFSYIEAMKESKSLPSSSNSSSTSTIESPPLNDTLQPHPEEVEIPIQIKLVAPMAKSRSQSSIFHLFRSTFSPFQMRKWRSKSRDKLLASASPSEALTSAHSDVSQTAQTNHCAPPQPDNNYSYTSSLSSSSSDSSYRHKSSPRLSPNASARQLSYLKLTCLLNGYDKYEFKDDKADSLKSIYLKSSKALCTDRYYDVKPGFRRYTSSARQPSACDHDAQVYKSELSVRLNVQEEKADGDAMAPDQNQHMTDELVVHNGKQEELTECNEEANTTDQAHDGHYYIGLLEKTSHQINNLCLEFQVYVDETNENCVKNEDVQGQIQTAIGKGQLLINQKFKQFRGLCDKNISAKNDSLPLKEGEFVTRDEDLAGFWDMVYLQVEDINKMFEKLSELRKNNWVSETKPVVKAPPKKKISTGLKTTETAASKARAEAARQRIQEMKKKAALAKNQNTEQPNAQIIN